MLAGLRAGTLSERRQLPFLMPECHLKEARSMTDASNHAAPAAHAPANDLGGPDIPDAHAAHDAHEGEEPLGPIDTQAWLAGIVGVAIGLLTAACFVLATAGSGAY
jgi:hypothetical protein